MMQPFDKLRVRGIYSVSEPVELGLTFPQKLCPSTSSGSGGF
ncbi:MAG: hypothetical protein ACKO16_16125 [Gemmataceae bacterium]